MNPPVFETRVAFSDTDAMTVVHHSRYLDFCDEARRFWCRDEALLTALEFRVAHLKPAFFDDVLTVHGQWRSTSERTIFQYSIYKGSEKITEAESTHRRANNLKDSPWTENWLTSLNIRST